MAGNRRLNPAELKARLQANLAVAGAKSSDPNTVIPVHLGEKPQSIPEVATSPLEGSDTRPGPQLSEPLKPSPTEQEAPKTHGKPSTEPSRFVPPQALPQPLRNSDVENTAQTTREPSAQLSNVPSHPEAKGATTATLWGKQFNEPNVRSISETAASSADTETKSIEKDSLHAARTSPQAVSQTSPQTGTKPPTTSRPIDEPSRNVLTVQRRDADPSAPATIPARKRAAPLTPVFAPKSSEQTVLHRRDGGAVLRGYRIPVDLHRQAERAKLGLASRRGSSLFWDELLQGAIDLLLDDTHRISTELSAARRAPQMATPSTRVLQAAIRQDQDLRLRMLRIDLEEIDGATVRLEEIWTWLIRQVVKNEG